MKRRIFLCAMLILAMVFPVRGEPIRWVDFQVPYESLKYTLDQDVATFEQEKHLSWIDILSLAACRTGGRCGLASVKEATADLKGNQSPEEQLGSLYKYYDYYHKAYTAVLGGLVGSYAIQKEGRQSICLEVKSCFSKLSSTTVLRTSRLGNTTEASGLFSTAPAIANTAKIAIPRAI